MTTLTLNSTLHLYTVKMARTSTLRLFKIKSYLNLASSYIDSRSSLNKISVRYLRRSRYGKDLNQEELKYQRLLRTFKYGSKPVEPEASSTENELIELPKTAAESSVQCTSDQESSIRVTSEELSKKLEEKFIPLAKLSYMNQLSKKYRRTSGVLRLLGRKLELLNIPVVMGEEKLPCPVDYLIPSPVVEAYRNSDEFSIGLGLDGNEKTVGFFLDPPTEFSTPFCIAPTELPIIRENHKKFAEDFQNYIRLSPLPATQHFSDKGYWKSLIVRSTCAGDLMGIVVIHPQDLSEKDLQLEKDKLKDYFSCIPKSSYNLQSLYFQTCTHSRCTHEQSPFELILGDSFITEEINNIKLRISPDSFFQVNTKATESMLNSVIKLCRVNKSTTVLDISCGIGALSCLFSPRVRECIGIDDSIQAIHDARANALKNNIQNTEFICSRPENVLNDTLSKNYHQDLLVVLNSSRCTINKPVITSLREFKKVDKIVYISNKPKVAVENIVNLCRPCGPYHNLGRAFLPILAVPFDLCPQTDQFGLVMMLQRI